MTLNEALDIFASHQSEIASACQINIMHLIRTHQPAKALDVDSVWTVDDIHSEVNRLTIERDTEGMIKTLNAINRRNQPVIAGRITDTMIERAREYPIEELIEIKRGLGVCLWHNDTNPSLHYYKEKNRVHCFVCEKNADSIDVVMVQDRCGFPQAVKRLCK